MTSASSVASTATQRPLTVARRRDIQAQPLEIRGRRWWRLKDPLALRFWQLGEEEYFLWCALEDGVSGEELESRFRHRFAPRRIDQRRIQNFLVALHREGLIYSSGPNQGAVLNERRRDHHRRQSWSTWTNPLAIRFRGINPSEFFDWLTPRIAWMFSPMAWSVLVVGWVSALLLLLSNSDRFAVESTNWLGQLTPTHLMWLALSMAGVKVAHELGHALTCHYYGGRCHELGVMLLVFTPCLYCNVSDAWLIPSRFRRMAISAAGICVELTLAAVATWIWWWSPPGAWSAWSLNVMAVCSANTLLLNGNPLLRYDGYFLLSDFLELPNLRAASDAWVARSFQWCAGGDVSRDLATTGPESHWFVPWYGFASWVYRWCLTAVIVWVVYLWLAERGLAFLGAALGVVGVSGAAGRLVTRSWRAWKQPQRPRRHWGRAAISFLVVASCAAVALFIPLPDSVSSPAVLEPADAEPQYVSIAGVLRNAVAEGEHVRRGDVLATLGNDDLDRELQRLRVDRDLVHRQIETMRRLRVQASASGIRTDSAADRLPALEEQLVDLESRLTTKTAEAARLVVQASRDGQVFAPRRRPTEERDDELRSWSGTPLAPENRGCFLETGTQLCQLGDRTSRIAVIVDQAAIERIREGQPVTAWFTEGAGMTWRGQVRRVEEIQADAIPPELLARHLLPIDTTTGRPKLSGTYFQVSVELEHQLAADGQQPTLPWGSTGSARIHTPSTTIAARCLRWLAGIWAARP